MVNKVNKEVYSQKDLINLINCQNQNLSKKEKERRNIKNKEGSVAFFRGAVADQPAKKTNKLINKIPS